jgi:hypothetical protein
MLAVNEKIHRYRWGIEKKTIKTIGRKIMNEIELNNIHQHY